MLYEHTTKPTSTHSHSTAGNGLTKLNKWNHCDLNERQSRSDIQKCIILSPSFHQFISRPSVSFGLCLCWGHPQTPPFLFVSSPLMSLFFTFAFRYTPFPLMCFFFHLFDLSVKSVREPAVRSPCYNDDGLNCSVEMTPELSGCGPFSLSPLTSSLISPHSVASFHLWKSIPAVVKVKEGLKSTRSKCWSLKKN